MSGTADWILTNGKIIADPTDGTIVEALAVERTKVIGAGTVSEVQKLANKQTRIVDLRGRTVVPGLIDSHLHFVRAGLSWTDEVRISHVRSITELLALISEHAESPSITGWVAIVGGWHPGQFAERRLPTREELDSASPETPVYIQYGYDRALLNTAAIKTLDLGAQMQLGKGIERDVSGQPTGTVYGKPAFAFCLTPAMDTEPEHKVTSAIQMFRDLTSMGLTGAVDTGGGARMGPEAYRTLMEAARRGGMPFKGRLYVHPHGSDEMAELDEYLRQLHHGFGNDTIRYVGIGEIVLHGCYDGPGFDDFTIDPDTKELLYEATLKCIQLGWPVNIHAIKDETLKTILDVWERVDKVVPLKGRRFSISHADGASVESLKRIRALDAGITVQDRLTIRTVDSAAAWGEDRATHAPPLRTMLDLGIPLGGGTDATVAAPISPWIALSFFVTGKPIDNGPQRAEEHRLSRLEALTLYTTGSAWFSNEEDTRGKLLPGFDADLAVLSADYLTVPDEDIERIGSDLTLVGGEVAYVSRSVFPKLTNERKRTNDRA